MRLPDFLIIGAMKAGTTSLYRDLLTNPAVFMPPTKEPNTLCNDRVLTDPGRREYAELFKAARPDQICGEASTAYTKMPTYTGVPQRAHAVLGPQLKLIYLVRNPLQRTISHHHHAFSYGRAARSIDEAVRSDPAFIQYSCYAMQVEPWLATFSPDNLRIILFEEYIRDRPRTIESLSTFLGLEPRPDLVQSDKIFNRAEDRTARVGTVERLRRSAVYRRFLRHVLPFDLKDRIRAAVLPKAPPRPDPPTPDTIAIILNGVRDDAARLAAIMGRRAPLWDLDAQTTPATASA